MPKKFFVYFIILGMLVVSCDGPITFRLDETFELEAQQTKFNFLENLRITADYFYNDSRCPADVVCVWEGRPPGVRLTFQKGRQSESFDIYDAAAASTDPLVWPMDLDFSYHTAFGYTVKLTGLRFPSIPDNEENPTPDAAYLLIKKSE